MDEWVFIEGFEDYDVSAQGEVRNHHTLRILRPYKAANGHQAVTLRRDGKPYGRMVHQLVAIAFLERPEWADTPWHINLDPTDNRAVNLKWAPRWLVLREGWYNGEYLLGSEN